MRMFWNDKRTLGAIVGTIGAAVALTVATCCGCGGAKLKGLKPVEGVVLYEGVPLAWASVALTPTDATPGAKMATAITDENGRFKARTLGCDGAFPGEYAVAVEKYIADEGDAPVEDWEKRRDVDGFKEPKPSETVLEVVSAIPLEYSNPRESGLTATVPEKGVKNLTFELKK